MLLILVFFLGTVLCQANIRVSNNLGNARRNLQNINNIANNIMQQPPQPQLPPIQPAAQPPPLPPPPPQGHAIQELPPMIPRGDLLIPPVLRENNNINNNNNSNDNNNNNNNDGLNAINNNESILQRLRDNIEQGLPSNNNNGNERNNNIGSIIPIMQRQESANSSNNMSSNISQSYLSDSSPILDERSKKRKERLEKIKNDTLAGHNTLKNIQALRLQQSNELSMAERISKSPTPISDRELNMLLSQRSPDISKNYYSDFPNLTEKYHNYSDNNNSDYNKNYHQSRSLTGKYGGKKYERKIPQSNFLFLKALEVKGYVFCLGFFVCFLFYFGGLCFCFLFFVLFLSFFFSERVEMGFVKDTLTSFITMSVY